MATNPTLLTQPIAANGAKNVIPNTTATPGAMSQDQGFPAETSLPLGAGGVAPSREDFNGAFNLLGGVAFYAQKGWKFLYDNDQDYYSGCIVRDADDWKLYECVADMTAGTVAPHSDTANDYWKLYTSGLSRELIPAFNKRDAIATSGTYTAPVTGWYRITIKGGGGGGASASGGTSYNRYGGASGGEGGTTIAYEHLDAGDTATVVVGAGGTGGVFASGGVSGSDGGDSSVTVNSNTYTGGGGKAGNATTPGSYSGGLGGTGTIPGVPGSGYNVAYTSLSLGASGGGAGGAKSVVDSAPSAAVNGGGGAGGADVYGGSAYSGGDGGDGFVWFEYFAAAL